MDEDQGELVSQTRDRQQKRTDLRDALIGVATTEFAQRGYAAPTLREITKAAKVSLPMVYWVFADKRHLYIDCCIDVMEQSMRLIGEAIANAEQPLDIVYRAVRQVVSFHMYPVAKLHHRVLLDKDMEILDELRRVMFTSRPIERTMEALRQIQGLVDIEFRLFSIFAYSMGFVELVAFWRNTDSAPIDVTDESAIARYVLAAVLPEVDWSAVG